MARILLFNPSAKFGGSVQPRNDVPIGLLSIATSLDHADYEVTIVDQRVDSDWRRRFCEELDKGPVCVGITSMTGPQIAYGLDASRLVRQRGGIPIVWGGVHPTLMPEQTVQNENIDFVVEGEGEETFFELVQALENGSDVCEVKGIWYKPDGVPTKTAPRPRIDIGKQAPLAYHLVDLQKYLVGLFGRGHLSFETSRGCRFRCTFCYNTRVHNNKWRGFTIDETVRRMRRIIDEYGIRNFLITDDNFFDDRERALGILQRIKDEKLGISISQLDTHITAAARLTDSDIRLISDSGCKMLKIGVESGSPRVLRMIRKGLKIPDLIELNKRFLNFDVTPFYFMMAGYPTETFEELSATMSLFLRLMKDNERAGFLLSIFTPFPGTDLYDLSVEHGLEEPQALEEWVSFNYRTVNKACPWLSEQRRKLIQVLHFATMLAQKNYFHSSFQSTDALASLAAKVYQPIALKRVENLYYKFPIELKLAEWIGLYPKQAGNTI